MSLHEEARRLGALALGVSVGGSEQAAGEEAGYSPAALAELQREVSALEGRYSELVVRARALAADASQTRVRRAQPETLTELVTPARRKEVLAALEAQHHAEESALHDEISNEAERIAAMHVGEPQETDQVRLIEETRTEAGRLQELVDFLRQELATEEERASAEESTAAEYEEMLTSLKAHREALEREAGGEAMLSPTATERERVYTTELRESEQELTEANSRLYKELDHFLSAVYEGEGAEGDDYGTAGAAGAARKRRAPAGRNRAKATALRNLLADLLQAACDPDRTDYIPAPEDDTLRPALELLLQSHLAELHPTDRRRIRVTPFHR